MSGQRRYSKGNNQAYSQGQSDTYRYTATSPTEYGRYSTPSSSVAAPPSYTSQSSYHNSTPTSNPYATSSPSMWPSNQHYTYPASASPPSAAGYGHQGSTEQASQPGGYQHSYTNSSLAPVNAQSYSGHYPSIAPQPIEPQLSSYTSASSATYGYSTGHVAPPSSSQPTYTHYLNVPSASYSATEDTPSEEDIPMETAPPSPGFPGDRATAGKGTKARRSNKAKTVGFPKQTFTCEHPNCTSRAQFTRLADLQRHENTVHVVSQDKPFPCPVKRCNRVGERGFTRLDHLREHQRSFHGENIPKRKPGQRSANQTYPPQAFGTYPSQDDEDDDEQTAV